MQETRLPNTPSNSKALKMIRRSSKTKPDSHAHATIALSSRPFLFQSTFLNGSSLAFLCVAMIALTGLAGCTDSATVAQNSESKKILNPEIQEVASDLDDGTKQDTPKNEIPKSFPNDVFVADDPVTVHYNKKGESKNLILDYAANDHDAFVEQCQDSMTGSGWKTVTSSELALGTITNFSKDARKCTITIGRPKDGLIKVAIKEIDPS